MNPFGARVRAAQREHIQGLRPTTEIGVEATPTMSKKITDAAASAAISEVGVSPEK